MSVYIYIYVSINSVEASPVCLPLPSQSSDTVALSSTTERQMQVSKLPRQQLPSGSQALIKWAEQRGYRPVSFTGTAVANLFTLRLRELGKTGRRTGDCSYSTIVINKYCRCTAECNLNIEHA